MSKVSAFRRTMLAITLAHLVAGVTATTADARDSRPRLDAP